MAEVTLSAEQYRRLVRLITEKADIRTDNERDILLNLAGLHAFGSRLHPGTQAKVFSAELISELQRYGTLKETAQPALVSLLCYLRESIEWDKPDAEFFDALLAPYRPCGDANQDKTPGTQQPTPIASSAVVRILFLAANPRDTSALRLGEEVRTIEERLNEAKLRDRFQLIQHHAVRWTDLSKYLLAEQPHIVHFSGHGTESSELVMEDQSGNMQIISAWALSDLFRILKDNIRVVVFNACWSEKQARVVTQEIDCTIGMTQPISDEAAVRFAAGFYRGIGFGRSVQTAFELGKNELAGVVPSNADIPQLLFKPGADPAKIAL